MKNKTIISIIVVILVFLYWKSKKSKKGKSCADLWNNIAHQNAEQFFTEALNLMDSTDFQNAISVQATSTGQDVEVVKCIYAVDYVYDHPSDGAEILTKAESEKVKKCICEKFNG